MRLPLLIAIGVLALVFAGCAGGDDDADGQKAAASSPAATPAGSAVDAPCRVPDDIKSYRFAMGMKMDIPGLDEALDELGDFDGFEGLEEATPADGEGFEDGLDEFGEALAPLMGALLGGLTDMSVEGAFVAPDRAESRMKLGDLEMTSITIGDREWTKLGDMEWQESAADEGGMAFTSDLCEDFSFHEISGLEASDDTVNGIEARHYHLDEADVTRLAELFGEDVEDVWDIEGLSEPEEVNLDLWLASDGNWPVRMEAEATAKDELGNDMSLSFFMEIKDLNDPDIKIEPPLLD